MGWTMAGAQEARDLFNGRDLEGWSGDPRLWRVEDGAIVGETDGAGRKIEANTFLVWEGGTPADFELSFKARVTGNNSGVQYRSRRLEEGEWRLGGYQMDLHPNPPYLGMLYEERGRGIACERGQKVRLAAGLKPEVIGELPIEKVDLAEWNEFRIVARGHRLQHFVNGKPAAQITDMDPEQRAKEGLIGLQLHSGPAMRAEFKDLRLRALPAGEVCWIWSGREPGPSEVVHFRRVFELPAGLKSARLAVSCDNSKQVWVNGHDLGRSWDWSTPTVYDVLGQLKPGEPNVIAVRGVNEGGPAGMALRLSAVDGDGKPFELRSDGTWRASREADPNWQAAAYDDSAWGDAVVVGRMGDAPWGSVLPKKAAGAAADEGFAVLGGFKLEKLFDVPSDQGSWVAMTLDDQGRLICSDQYGGLYRVHPDKLTIEKLELAVGGAHGLLWHRGALYVTVNEGVGGPSGVYRVDDSDGDGTPDTPTRLKAVKGRGEHGPHALVASPDGEWIYFAAGNHTELPELDGSLVARVWGEDQLLERRPDANGHATGRMAPGGWIARFRPDGSDWQLVSIGYRNQYDLAFNEAGDLFTYDADMEWDLGLPWYRPTRICHVLPGAEFGWRYGTGKWPAYYEDSMPAVVDIGPGSPSGLVSGRGARFPAKYQRALYALDWTYATIHVIHLRADGAGYAAEREELVSGKGLPLTDAVIGRDGSLYFTTGGRRTASGLWRVSYVGEEPTEPVEYADTLAPLLGGEQPEWAEALVALGSDDRVLRQRARLALEASGEFSFPLVTNGITGEWARIGEAIMQARLGGEGQRKRALPGLLRVDWSALDKPQQLGWLRAVGLAFIRGGEPTPEERQAVLGKIDAAFPADDDDLNAELCRMLCYLRAPGVVGRTLALMDRTAPPVAPDWLKLAARNPNYGRAVRKMIANLPPTQIVHYVYCLRTVEGPWERSERERFFDWLDRLASRSGGASYGGFIEDLRRETLKRAVPPERRWLDQRPRTEKADPLADLPPVEGPGRAWTVDEVVKVAEGGLAGADAGHGREMFRAVLCAACHSVGGQGGAAGPDLSTLAGRFTVRDLAEALIEPSKVVSDQYAFEIFSRKDGGQTVGRLLAEKDEHWIIATNPFDFSQTQEIERNQIASTKPSPVSPMPGGLINRLNESELKDLLAYLLGGS